jgi:hypothetical protein
MPDLDVHDCRFREHSVQLNGIGWRLAKTLGYVGPGDSEVNADPADLCARLIVKYEATKAVLAYREKELLDLKGPCSNTRCRLHRAHSGPCDCDA